MRTIGPAWLSFVRPNGSIVHVYEIGPGACGGPTVNGVRRITDEGTVWNLILAVTEERRCTLRSVAPHLGSGTP